MDIHGQRRARFGPGDSRSIDSPAIIRARLSRLSPNAFSLLAAGAVLEQSLTHERLCAIANVPADVGLPALDELVSSQLLVEPAPGGTAGAYAFDNDLLRNVVYTEAGEARRRLFHRRALAVLEPAGAPEAVLAHHAVAAGLAELAVRHSLLAGAEALRLSALAEALVHCRQARRQVRDMGDAGSDFDASVRELCGLVAQAYASSGLADRAQSILEALRDG